MNRLAQVIVTLSLALWLGGLVALFLFVSAMFKHDRTVAIQAAPVLFEVFAMYQLGVGFIGLLGLLIWRTTVRSSLVSSIIVLFALSLGCAAYVTFSIIPEMTGIRETGQAGDSPRFKALHGRSMIFYSSQTIALLLSALMLPGAVARTGREAELARGSPGAIADPAAAR